jgi:hypothetical protein
VSFGGLMTHSCGTDVIVKNNEQVSPVVDGQSHGDVNQKGNERWKLETHKDLNILLLKLSIVMPHYQEGQEIYLLYGKIRCSRLLEYIRDISILGRLGLYLYPTRSVGEASCPPSHVPLYIQSQGSG